MLQPLCRHPPALCRMYWELQNCIIMDMSTGAIELAMYLVTQESFIEASWGGENAECSRHFGRLFMGCTH